MQIAILFQKPHVPVYDKTKKEIISMPAEKSVDIHGQHRKLKLNRITGKRKQVLKPTNTLE